MKTKILILLWLFTGCSTIQLSNRSSDQFMPLSIGNTWIYNSMESYEIVSIDTVNAIPYYKFKTSCITEGKPAEYFYWQRISNDTLFLLTYDVRTNQYVECVEAIFSLNENDVAHIHVHGRDTMLSNDLRILPSGDTYSIKVLGKTEETIEFIICRGVDLTRIVVYKKGTGIIKTKNDWGIEQTLTECRLH